jgi:chromate transporter
VDERKWMEPQDFEDGVTATSLLPGPASTQLAIFCGWRLRGALGGIVAGICFISPGLIVILALAAAFLSDHPARWILGAAAGAGAAVPAVALNAARNLAPASWRRLGTSANSRARWVAYALIGAVTSTVAGPYLVVVLLACGAAEVILRRPGPLSKKATRQAALATGGAHLGTVGGLGALAWVAVKVGALSYGGGFVIVPLMQHDVVDSYHWMTASQFLTAVTLGQITPGPVVQTVAVVGYAAAGFGGGLLAAFIAFVPSFVFVLAGGVHFDRVRSNTTIQGFFAGASPAVVGAIAGSSIPLGLALQRYWQVPVLAAACLWLFFAPRRVVAVLLVAGLAGVVLALAGVAV